MKLLCKIVIALLIFNTCLFINTDFISAQTTLDCTNTLKNKSSGEQVKILQKELNVVMSTCNLTVDGSFGSATSNCVIKFQREYNLSDDGFVGASTAGKVNVEY